MMEEVPRIIGCVKFGIFFLNLKFLKDYVRSHAGLFYDLARFFMISNISMMTTINLDDVVNF